MDHNPQHLYDCHVCKYYYSGSCGPRCKCGLPLDGNAWPETEHMELHRLQLLLIDGHVREALRRICEIEHEHGDEWRQRYERLREWPTLVEYEARVRRMVDSWAWNASPRESAYEARCLDIPTEVIHFVMDALEYPKEHIAQTIEWMRLPAAQLKERWSHEPAYLHSKFERDL